MPADALPSQRYAAGGIRHQRIARRQLRLGIEGDEGTLTGDDLYPRGRVMAGRVGRGDPPRPRPLHRPWGQGILPKRHEAHALRGTTTAGFDGGENAIRAQRGL